MIESSLSPSEPVLLPERPSGRTVRSIAGYALLTALMLTTKLLVFIPAALLHCAMRNGRRAAWAAAVVALLITAAFTAAAVSQEPKLAAVAWSVLGGVTLSLIVPTLAAIPLVERAAPFGHVVMFLLIGSLAGLLLTEGASRAMSGVSPYAAQADQVKAREHELAAYYGSKNLPAEAMRGLEQGGRISRFVLAGQMLAELSLYYVLSLLMLGRVRAWRDHVARRGESEAARVYLFRNFALPDWVLFAFVFAGLTPLTTGLVQQVAANALVVAIVLYTFQGLAVFRSIFVSRGIGIAGMILVTLMWPVAAVTGLFDPFFDFRKTKKRKDDSHESHSD